MKIRLLLLIFIFIPSGLIYGQKKEWDDEEVLKYAFTFPMDWTFGQKNKEIGSLADLNQQLNELYIPSELFFTAYDSLTIDSAKQETKDIFNLTYEIGGRSYHSYSLFKPALYKDKGITTATVLIPGSGENQSTHIFNGVGYHGNIARELIVIGDLYVAVKPNQDFLAIHKNGGKLSYDFSVNYLVNMGGSYSVSYIINTLATVKHLKTKYDRVFVVGLSQGALAALYNSLQSSPDAAVIASGFSVTRDVYEWSGHNQIIIPNSINELSNEYIKNRIGKQSTNYFFSWGRNEEGPYKLEAENKYTSQYFEGLKNVEYVYHDQGHSVPQPYANEFLVSIPFANLALKLTNQPCRQQIYLKPVNLSSHAIFEKRWYRNDTLIADSGDSLMLQKGGNYKLVVASQSGRIYESKSIKLSPQHFKRNLQQEKRVIIAPDGFLSYQWYLNGKILENENEKQVVIRQAGRYTCCLTSDLGSFTSDEVLIKDNYAFMVKNLEVKVYPNPNNGQFNLELVSPDRNLEKVKVVIYGGLGRTVYENTYPVKSELEEFRINTTGLQNGVYFIKIITPEKTFNQSILISKNGSDPL